MLESNVIIYDHECPLCNAYTGAFIKFKLLDENGREKYCNLENFSCNYLIDKNKARHEIALVDTQSQKVRYGLDSLFYILGSRFPVLNLLFKQKYFLLIMKQLYFFISYNRKVIAPSTTTNKNSCAPDFNLVYRLSYILFALIVVSFFALHFQVFVFLYMYYFLQTLVYVLIKRNNQDKLISFIHYVGHQSTVLLIGCLLLIPSLFYNNLLIYNIVIAGLVMGKEFWRRRKDKVAI